MHRRTLLQGALLGALTFVLPPARSRVTNADRVVARLAELERRRGGRLGVALFDSHGGRHADYRGDERFLLCSTFKLLLVSAVLTRVDHRAERLDRRIVFGNDAVLDYAPVTRHQVGPPGMTVAALCKAAITLSDNTAANLLLASVGGPAALTRYARGLGDPVTRLDRTEPSLNVPDGERDTTTPRAMLADLRRVLLGDALTAVSCRRLRGWMQACRTGTHSLRAGLPSAWRSGDKTGQGAHVNNDIAVVWPPQRKPLLVTAYYANVSADADARKSVLAEVGRIVTTW